MGAAQGQGTIPWIVVEAGLCERLHCRPSELEREDVGGIIRGLDLLDLYRALRKPFGELSDADKERVGRALQE